jgi:integrase
MGNTKGRRRRFGAVRQLPSGQWQARYRGPDGLIRPAPRTFPTKTSAEQWLTRTEAGLLDGDWIDPVGGLTPFGEYAAAWIEERPGLRPATLALYRYLLRHHLATSAGFQTRPIADITPAHVRRWHKSLTDSGTNSVTVAKAYRLFKAVMSTAVDDGIIRRNPCRIKGAGQEKSPERPVLTIQQVFALADVIDPRYRALILLAVFASLRWGELAALRRSDIDLTTRAVEITRSLTELPGGGHAFGPPKSAAGLRVVCFPDLIVADLTWHLARFAASGDDALVFTSPTGAPLRRGNFRRRVWIKALASAGLPDIHFHDLRHTGNNLSADAGANLRELMERMGHSSTQAALVHLHATNERQRAVADAIGYLAQAVLSETVGNPADRSTSGTNVARRDKQRS